MQTVKTRFPKLTFEEFIELSHKLHPPKSKKEIVRELKQQIREYEQKYNMKTRHFIVRYDKGDFEMDDNYNNGDLFEWKASYEALQRMLKQ